MPRKSRHGSQSGFIHVIVRGIGKQILFEDKSDYRYFLSILKDDVKDYSLKICAYCLMENHVHFLIFDKNNEIPLLMKKIGISYAMYYNKKYQRTGHVFQDRYKSEPIEDERGLLTVFRYIIKNPEKAGICQASKYEWSSYRFYGTTNSIVDTSVFVEVFDDREKYEAFIAEKENDQCMEFEPARKTDEEAMGMIKKMGIASGTLLQSYPKIERNKAIAEMLQAGISVRQIERLTGISRGIIQKAKR